jgi:hypothetical protein
MLCMPAKHTLLARNGYQRMRWLVNIAEEATATRICLHGDYTELK